MNYWRMQLHPSGSKQAAKSAAESLSAGFIGLDFKNEVGDLNLVDPSVIESKHRHYQDFCKKMKVDDTVLIIVHHFPFALCTVVGEYNFIARPEPEIGVWFRHFRRIDVNTIRYFADHKTDVRKYEQFIMPNAISILNDQNSKSYKLIEEWSK